IILTLIPAHRDVFIIFDQLDRAWDATQDTKDVLIGLLLAAKDLIRDATSYQKAVRVIVFLRDDIYDQLRFQDKNKITQSDMIELRWNEANLRELIERRARSSSNFSLDDIMTTHIVGNRQYAVPYMLSRT